MTIPNIYTSDQTIQFDDTLRAELFYYDGDDDVSIQDQEIFRLTPVDDGVVLTISSGAEHVIIPWKYMPMLAQGIMQLTLDRKR